MNEIIMEGTTALIAGMGTVFIILVLISVVISLFEHLDPETRAEKRLARLAKKGNPIEVTEEPVEEAQDTSDQEEMLRVVAAISVALAKSLNTSVDRLQVRSIRRL